MTSTQPSSEHPAHPAHYEIRVDGQLGSRWAAWFEGAELIAERNGVTMIRTAALDQAALHGLLAKLRDLGLPLRSLVRRPPSASPETPELGEHPCSSNPTGATP